jgi:hypothetical protein
MRDSLEGVFDDSCLLQPIAAGCPFAVQVPTQLVTGPTAGAESMPSGGKLSFSSTVSQPECDSEVQEQNVPGEQLQMKRNV